MGLILDSFVLASPETFIQTLPDFVRTFSGEEVFLFSAGAAELLEAAYRTKDPVVQARRLAFAERILSVLPQISADDLTTRAHARLCADLHQNNLTLHPNTTWPAAYCLAHSWTLVTTRPRLYEGIAGLRIHSCQSKAST